MCAILCAVFVGSISTVSKPVLSNTNPLMYGGMVYLLASVSSIPASLGIKGLQIRKKHWPIVLAITASGSILAPSFFFTGLEQTTASDTAILSNSETIFTVLFAMLFFKEKIRLTGYIATALVLSGVFIVTTDLQFSNFFEDFKKVGNILIILSMALWALDNNLSKIATHHINISRLVQIKGLLGGGVLLAISFASKTPLGITTNDLPNLLLVGFVGFGLALYLFLHSLKRIGTVKTMLIYSTGTIFGLIFAHIFLHEKISGYQIFAMIIILVGIYLVTKESRELETISKN